jgi:hypothetical protein
LATIDFAHAQRAAKSQKADSALGHHFPFQYFLQFRFPAAQLDSDARVH